MLESSVTPQPRRYYATRSLVVLVGLMGILLSLFEFWYSSQSLYAVKFAASSPSIQQHEYPHFYFAFYVMSFISFSLEVLLFFTSLQLLSFRMGWSLLLAFLMVFELIYFRYVVAAWFHPTFGKSIMAASGLANGSLVGFHFTKYPYWAPLIAFWGWYRLPAPPPNPKTRRRIAISFVSLLIILCGTPLVCMALFRRDQEVEYHKVRMRWAHDLQLVNPQPVESMPGVSAFSVDDNQSAIYEQHRQRLIELGVVTEFNYTCRHLFHGTPEGRHFQAIRPKAPWSIDGESPYSTDHVPIHWTFWCFTEDVPRIVELFEKYDIPNYRKKFMTEPPNEPPK
ncbi:MAG: hypothetical protein KDA36_01565 [Planctomycetaceae bacterium]|nr:hypothetical protein [Planctomycetaceae bacterium]